MTTSGRNVDLPSLKRGEIRDPALTAALRKLELTVRRKLDGFVHTLDPAAEAWEALLEAAQARAA